MEPSELPTLIERAPPRVLVVDHDPAIRRLLERTLSRWGYFVTTACSVETAERAARELRPHVVVLDVWLGAEDGREILRRLSQRRPPLVVVFSGMPPDDAHGVDAFVRKPTHILDLVEQVHALVRRQRSRSAPARAGDVPLP